MADSDGGSDVAPVVVVSAGLGNVGSVVNMCRRLGVDPMVSDDPDLVRGAGRLLLPGVGAFDVSMAALVERGLDEALREAVAAGTPVLGICLGMQLLFDASEEGTSEGLGFIPGIVRRLAEVSPHGPVSIPHMGWSRMEACGTHPVLDGLDGDARYYFVHSYAAVPRDEQHVIGLSVHGTAFVSAVARDNVLGVQFHPEKSHRYGKALLANYLRGV